jgi:hypothetical protein
MEGCLKGRGIVEVAATLGGPLPTLSAVAVAALAGPFDLDRRPLERGADLITSISVTDCLSPSGVSQLRWRSRPVTMTRSPLESESARCSACPRHTLTLRNEVSPSRHLPSCWTCWVTATRLGVRARDVVE